MKIKKIKVTDYKVLQNFEIDFCDSGKILDVIVLAGINGCGKTTILDLIEDSFDKDFRFNDDDFIDFSMKDFQKLIYFRVFENPKELVISKIKNFIDLIKDNNEDLTIKQANQKAISEVNSNIQALFPNGSETKTKMENYLKNMTGSRDGTVDLTNLSNYLQK